METITCTFSLSILFARFSLRPHSPRLPREAAHLHETSDILRVVRERKDELTRGWTRNRAEDRYRDLVGPNEEM